MTILVYATVLFTIVSALGFGIIAGYVVIMGVLRLFGYSTRAKTQSSCTAPSMQPAIAPASGD